MRIHPLSNEFPEHFSKYVNLVPEGDIDEILLQNRSETLALLSTIPEHIAERAYAPGKWTVKEVVGHLADAERITSYRMLSIARKAGSTLPGVDPELYVASANFNKLPWVQIQSNFDSVRFATLSLIDTIDEQAWLHKGTVLNNTVSTRALGYLIAGHEIHHRNVIHQKYL